MSAPAEEGGQDDDDILGFPGDGFEDKPDTNPGVLTEQDEGLGFVHVLLCGPCGGKVRPLWPSLHLHLVGQNLNVFFFPLQRMTDTDGLRETPHRSSVVDGMGGPNPPSVIRTGWYRKMGLGIRGRTDCYGDPKTDRTAVHSMYRGGRVV